MSPRQTAAIKRIDAEDFSGVVRKVKEEFAKLGMFPSDEYLEAGVLALKQYYTLPVLDPRNMHAVSDALDPFWHAHILHTEQYAKFCNDAVGAFMHHDPLDHDRPADVAAVDFLYDYTIEVMRQIFNHMDERFYPATLPKERLVCMHGADIYAALREDDAILFPVVPEAQKAVLFPDRVA